MRIVQAVGWYFPSSTGGTEVYVAELSKRLQQAGHEVHVAAPEAGGRDERRYDHEKLPVFRYPIPEAATRDEAQERTTVRGAERFHDWLRRLNPDVVHMHTFVTGLGLPELRVAKATGARTIVTTHSASLGHTCLRGSMMRWGRGLCDGVVSPRKCAPCVLQSRGIPAALGWTAGLVPPSVGRVARLMPGPFGAFLGMSETVLHNQRAQIEMLHLVDQFVVLTEWARQTVLRNGADPSRVALNRLGVRFPATRRTRTKRSGEAVTMAYVGRFDAIKGVEDFARAIAEIPPSLPVAFEFHGPQGSAHDVELVGHLKRIAGPGASVTFGGELGADGIEALLQRIDVLCCPSRVLEGGPTVALEANAAGVPVVGSDIPGLSEIVKDGVTGRLVPVGDWQSLSRAISDVAADPAIIDRWRAALPCVRTMDDVTADYLALYRA